MNMTEKAKNMTYVDWINCKDKFETLGAFRESAFFKKQCAAWAYESEQRSKDPDWRIEFNV